MYESVFLVRGDLNKCMRRLIVHKYSLDTFITDVCRDCTKLIITTYV